MKKLISILVISSLGLAACGSKNGFQSVDNALTGGSTDNGSQGSGGGDGTGTGSGADWSKVDVDGYSSQSQLVIQIDKVNQAILLILPFPSFAFLPMFPQSNIPNLQGAYFTSYQTADGGSQLAISIPLKYVLKGAQFMPDQKLPSGDPLPYVPAGELPGFAIQFPQHPDYQVHLYIGVNVAAAFVELPDFGLPVGGVIPVKNKSKTKEVGAIGYVLPKGNFPGGMYLAAQIPKDMAIMIDNLIRW